MRGYVYTRSQMGAWNDFSNWISSETAALGRGVTNFATGAVNTAKFGLTTVIGAPVAIVHEITDGAVKIIHEGTVAFTAGAVEGGKAFGVGASAFTASAVSAGQAVGSLGKSAGGAVGSLGSSFAWPLAAVGVVLGGLFILKRELRIYIFLLL